MARARWGEVDRLDQVVQGPALHAQRGTGGVVDRGQHQERDGGLELHDLRNQIDTAGARQVHVQQHAGDLLAPEDGQRLLAGRGGHDLVALLSQELADRVPDRLFIIDDEKGDRTVVGAHAHPPPGRASGPGGRVGRLRAELEVE